MHLRLGRGGVGKWAALVALAPALCFGARHRHCYTTGQAAKMIHKDICVTAHIYEVVRLPDGTRFLDVCSPTTPDAACRFTIVSFRQDRDDVGRLRQYRNKNVEILGIVQPMHGRAGIVLSQIRQFHGGPPRFRPNPRLLGGFQADSDQPAVYDPNLRSYGHGRSFMNSRDQETRPAK